METNNEEAVPLVVSPGGGATPVEREVGSYPAYFQQDHYPPPMVVEAIELPSPWDYVQRYWRRYRPWLVRNIWKLLSWIFFGACFSVVLAMAVMVSVNWLLFIGKRILQKFSLSLNASEIFWSVIDAISPSDTQEQRQEKKEEVTQAMTQVVQHFMGEAAAQGYDALFRQLTLVHHWFGIWGIFSVLLGAIGVFATSYKILLYLRTVGLRLLRRLRGVEEFTGREAIRPGSNFIRADVPSCQVAISLPGWVSDSHQGYGLRYQDYLVVPKHVLTPGGYLAKELVFSTAKASLVLPVEPINSAMDPDLAYLYFSPEIWSRLQSVNPKWVDQAKTTRVYCIGQKGYSVGTLSKTMLLGQMAYSGSTIPGMSGAAYFEGSPVLGQMRVMGIHQGVTGSVNIGLSSVAIIQELRQLYKYLDYYRATKPIKAVESSEDPAEQFVLPSNYASGWDDQNLRDSISKIDYDRLRKPEFGGIDGRNWAEEMDSDREGESNTQQIKTAAAAVVAESTSPPPQTAVKTVEEVVANVFPPGVRARVISAQRTKAQSVEQPEVLKIVMTEQANDFLSELIDFDPIGKITDLRVRVENLEARKPEIVPESTGQPKRFPCPKCAVVCKTALRLHNHQATSHKIKGESAKFNDEKLKTIKTTASVPFLGNGRVSRNKKGKLLTRNSSSSGKQIGSTSTQALLSEMRTSQKTIENALSKLLEAMAGPVSVTKQN